MEHLSQVAEIVVSYKTKVKAKDRPKITNSSDVYTLLSSLWNQDTIEYQESFYLILLNRSNAVLGYKVVSIGSSFGTVVDIKQMLAIALKTNASGIIVSHNHPSGNMIPSPADIDLTKKIKKACEIMDIQLLDHMIVSPDGTYYSFADEHML